MRTDRSRIESDSLGPVEIPARALYGIHAHRATGNLRVSARTLGDEPSFVAAFAILKKAAALANRDLGVLDAARCDAITAACDEVKAGRHDAHFVVDLMEGSGGTSSNMNVNEVIATRATAIGRVPVHANDHVNRSQSTNDIYPSAMKLAIHPLLVIAIDELTSLAAALDRHRTGFADVLQLGRTCLQDAQPMRLGQRFGGYAALVARAARALAAARDGLVALPLGGTAIGTGFGSPAGYREVVFAHLAALTDTAFRPADDPFDAMQNLDAFVRVSAELRSAALALGKIASDLILLSSGPQGGIGELSLPAVQAGSSIMPGKVNPVVPMSLVQIGFAIVGNDVSIAQAAHAGQLEINHFEPVVADRLFDSIRLLTQGAHLFRTRCVDGLAANTGTCERHVLASSALATALVPSLGYEAAAALVRDAAAAEVPLIDWLDRHGAMSRDDAIALARAAALPVPTTR